MTILKLIPYAFRLIHLIPDLLKLIAACRPVLNMAVAAFPQVAEVSRKILSDPDVQDILTKGEFGTEPAFSVVWLQETLNKLVTMVPPLEVDGEYGLETMDAVKRFQMANRLEVDGWAGAMTTAVLKLKLRELEAK